MGLARSQWPDMAINHLKFPLQKLPRSAFLLSSGETKEGKDCVVTHATRYIFLLALLHGETHHGDSSVFRDALSLVSTPFR
jgi:hypothetical protein